MAVYYRLFSHSDIFHNISKRLINCNSMSTSTSIAVSHIKENIQYVQENIDKATQQRKPEVILQYVLKILLIKLNRLSF